MLGNGLRMDGVGKISMKAVEFHRTLVLARFNYRCPVLGNTKLRASYIDCAGRGNCRGDTLGGSGRWRFMKTEGPGTQRTPPRQLRTAQSEYCGDRVCLSRFFQANIYLISSQVPFATSSASSSVSAAILYRDSGMTSLV